MFRVKAVSEISTGVDLDHPAESEHVEVVSEISTRVDAMSFSGNSFQIEIVKKYLLR